MWPFGRKKTQPPQGGGPDIAEELRRYIRMDIDGGFRPIQDIPQAAVEVLIDEFDESQLQSTARAVMEVELSAYRNDQSKWPDVTDCDRLDAAFSELQASGIVARQNAICCQTCAADEVWGEVNSKIKRGEQVRGMTFYHEQDTESAVEGQGLYLAYGATENSEAAAVSIGREVQQVLENHGLNVMWDGNLNQRIHVALDWKRRRADAAA